MFKVWIWDYVGNNFNDREHHVFTEIGVVDTPGGFQLLASENGYTRLRLDSSLVGGYFGNKDADADSVCICSPEHITDPFGYFVSSHY